MNILTLRYLLVSALLLTGCGGSCRNSGNYSVPDPQEYSSAETYLNTIGFSGVVLVRKSNTGILSLAFGYSDSAQFRENFIDTFSNKVFNKSLYSGIYFST